MNMERREIRTGKNVFFCVIWNRHYKIDVKSWIFCKKILQKCVMKLYIFAVVPIVGTWIEIFAPSYVRLASLSFPLWERGLKFNSMLHRTTLSSSRSPCGNVD